MPNEPIVGGDILRLITAGMYDNPLVLFREYIQNAADSVASRRQRLGSVQIDIDPLDGHLTITDDGPGLSHDEAVRRLVPIGYSSKDPTIDRGLRGIGRLSALAFAERIHFTTRSCSAEPVTRVSWSSRTLRDPRLQRVDAATAIQECTTVQSLTDGEWPEQFFQVAVEQVTRHAASTLLNRDAVRQYIAEVCPVPLSRSFPLASEVTNFLTQHAGHFALRISLDGEETAIERPFGKAIQLTDAYSATYESTEKRLIPRLDNDEPAAALWLAHTPYAGSIPRRLGVRGLRARVGNIQVGSEDVFSHLFHETRFNGWCVGEVHITDSRIVPNGRRDYFEAGPHLRNLENHLGAVAHEIRTRCRSASSHRNRLRRAEATIRQAHSAHELARSGYLLPEDAAAVLRRSSQQLATIKGTLDELQIALPASLAGEHSDLSDVERALRDAIGPVGLEDLPSGSAATLKSAFAAIVDAMPADSALHMIQAILSRLSDRAASVDRA